MSERVTLLLLLAIAAVLILGIMRQLQGLDQPPSLLPTPTSKAQTPAPKADAGPRADPVPPLSLYRDITARPLFIKGRKPPPSKPNTVQQPFAGLAFSLDGIIITPARKTVFLRPERGKKTLRLEEGETVEGWTLRQVSPDRAQFHRDARNEVLLLKPEPISK